jgi:hypothetical protein
MTFSGRRFLRSVRKPIPPRSNANASVPLSLNNDYFKFKAWYDYGFFLDI